MAVRLTRRAAVAVAAAVTVWAVWDGWLRGQLEDANRDLWYVGR